MGGGYFLATDIRDEKMKVLACLRVGAGKLIGMRD
jgi:hypothetical protein